MFITTIDDASATATASPAANGEKFALAYATEKFAIASPSFCQPLFLSSQSHQIQILSSRDPTTIWIHWLILLVIILIMMCPLWWSYDHTVRFLFFSRVLIVVNRLFLILHHDDTICSIMEMGDFFIYSDYTAFASTPATSTTMMIICSILVHKSIRHHPVSLFEWEGIVFIQCFCLWFEYWSYWYYYYYVPCPLILFQTCRIDTTSPTATAANDPTVYIYLFSMSSISGGLVYSPSYMYGIDYIPDCYFCYCSFRSCTTIFADAFERGGLCYHYCYGNGRTTTPVATGITVLQYPFIRCWCHRPARLCYCFRYSTPAATGPTVYVHLPSSTPILILIRFVFVSWFFFFLWFECW